MAKNDKPSSPKGHEPASTGDRLSYKEQWEIIKAGYAKGVKYDGCTGVPDFDFGADCCGEHDAHYQMGDVSRWEADKRMRKCIRKKGYFLLPWLYWFGVRFLAGGVWERYRNKENEETSDSGSSEPLA